MSKKTNNSTSNKKKKYKFTPMDYITIGFTAVIVVIMIIFLIRALKPEWFQKKSSEDNTVATASNPAATGGTEATAAPTETPVYSGIGNTYGNMANNSIGAEIDGLEFYAVDAGDGGNMALAVNNGTAEKVILDGEKAIISVNVIKDPFVNSDVAGSVSYKIIFIDGDGKLCAATYGPLPSDSSSSVDAENATLTEKNAITDGTFSSAVSVGEYVYAINEEGVIVRISLNDSSLTTLSMNKYSAICVYYGEIFALSQDGSIFVLKTSARPAADGQETGEGETSDETQPYTDEYEALISEGSFSTLTVFDDWIYAVGESGIVRFDSETYGRDSLSKTIKATAVSVDRNGIYLLVEEVSGDAGAAEEVLYKCTAKELLTGSLMRIGAFAASNGAGNGSDGGAGNGGYGITVLSDRIWVTTADGRIALTVSVAVME